MPAGYESYQCKNLRGYGKDGLFCQKHAKINKINPKFLHIPKDVPEV